MSLAEPRLPLQIDDASRPETDEVSTLMLFISSVQWFVKVFIIWLAPRAGKMNQIARCDWLPERAR